MGTISSPEKDPGFLSMPDINASFAVLRGNGGVPGLGRPKR